MQEKIILAARAVIQIGMKFRCQNSKLLVDASYRHNLCIVYASGFYAFKPWARARRMTETDGQVSTKKNSQLVLRLDKDERDAFVELCRELDTSAAREIRRFIREFMKEHEVD
ncbi:hypothetical protein [Ruegeria denitrificans]|nr:hypothetical protein [Ruegeria denitrificans]